jgi:hypothetical protein
MHNGKIYSKQNAWYIADFYELLMDFKPLLPEGKKITFVLNDLDEPRILPLDTDADAEFSYDRSKQMKYYNHTRQVIPKSACLRRNYPNELHKHAFFTSPSTFSSVSTLLPVFSPCKPSHCYRDILFPFRSEMTGSLKASQRKVINDTWSRKKSVLMWRGSTTGANIHERDYMERLSDVHQRFALVSWAMRQGCENVSGLGKHVDVAFSTVTQCSVAGCNESLRERYRFTPRMSRDEQYNVIK